MELINEALTRYAFKDPAAEFIRHNENMTYKITDGGKCFLLRIHKAALGLDFTFQCGNTPRRVFIASEIGLLNELGDKTAVQRPVKNKQGEYLTELSSGDIATVLTWIDGHDLTETPMTDEWVFQIGRMIGRLHNHCADLPKLERYRYDREMAERVLDEIKSGYELGHIGQPFYQSIADYLRLLGAYLLSQKAVLIHGDFSKSNIVMCGENLVSIDYSLSGYSLPEMDLADMLCSLDDETLTPFLLDGYRSTSRYSFTEDRIEVFRAFSVVMYIAYHHGKFDEKSALSLKRWCDTIINPASGLLLKR